MVSRVGQLAGESGAGFVFASQPGPACGPFFSFGQLATHSVISVSSCSMAESHVMQQLTDPIHGVLRGVDGGVSKRVAGELVSDALGAVSLRS